MLPRYWLYKPLKVHTHILLCVCVCFIGLIYHLQSLACCLQALCGSHANCWWQLGLRRVLGISQKRTLWKTVIELKKRSTAWHEALCGIERILPLLVPSGPLNTVHSSMLPKGSNSLLTSSSLCCFPSMPTNNFLSSERPRMCGGKGRKRIWIQLYIPKAGNISVKD